MENIDFHEKLIRANLEPHGVKLEFLELVRKETKLSKNAFSIKLSQAYNNLFDAYQGELVKAQNIMLTDIKDYNFPFFYLKKDYPGLINVSMVFGFDLRVSEKLLNELLDLITLYNEKRILKSVLKEFRNSIPIKEGQESKEFNELKNEFNKMDLEEIRNHFRPLTEKENSKGLIWMTADDFDIFIKSSFCGLDLKKPKINIGHGAKYAIVKLFYKFYDYCQNSDYTNNRKKDSFVQLLKDAFDTDIFNDLTNDNFKGDKNKYEWD